MHSHRVSRRLSWKCLLYAHICVAVIAACIIWGRFELLILGMPFIISILLPTTNPAHPVLFVRTDISGHRLYEGEEAIIRLDIHAASDLPVLEITHAVSAMTEEGTETSRFYVSLREGDSTTLTCRVPLTHRGVFILDVFHLGVLDEMGLVWWEIPSTGGPKVKVYPRSRPLQLRHSLIDKVGLYSGNYSSRLRGEGCDLAEIREYGSWDSARKINWRASLKWGKLFVTDRIQERNADVVIVIDTLQDIGHGTASYLTCTARAAASLAEHFLEMKDRVGLIQYSGVASWVKPALGKRQSHLILEELSQLRVWGSYVFREPRTIPVQILPPGSLIFVFTPLLDRRSLWMVVSLRLQGFNPIVIYVSPTALTERTAKKTRLDSLAVRWWNLNQRKKIRLLQNSRLIVITWDGVESLDQVINHRFAKLTALEKHQRRKPV